MFKFIPKTWPELQYEGVMLAVTVLVSTGTRTVWICATSADSKQTTIRTFLYPQNHHNQSRMEDIFKTKKSNTSLKATD